MALISLVISTVSFILAAISYWRSGPFVYLESTYRESARELSITIENSGRSPITIKDIRLAVVRERPVRRPHVNKYMQGYTQIIPTVLGDLPASEWCANADVFELPIRLQSNDSTPYAIVRPEVIMPLISNHNLSEVAVRYVVRIPRGNREGHIRREDLRRFVESQLRIASGKRP